MYIYVQRRNSRREQGMAPPILRRVEYSSLYPPPKLLTSRRNVVPPIVNAKLRHCICTYIYIYT